MTMLRFHRAVAYTFIGMHQSEEGIAWWERILCSLVLGMLGFVTGVVSVWMLSNVPGVEMPRVVSLTVGVLAGLGCAVFGYLSQAKTVDALGEVWQVVWKLSVGVLSVMRALAR